MRRDSFRDRLLDRIRRYDFLLYPALAVELLLAMLGVLSYLFADLPPETRAILLLDFALLGVLLPVTAVLLYLSRTTEPPAAPE